MEYQQLLDFDRKHIWHPYTSMTDPQPVYAVESASGVRLKLYDGRELIDGMSSWWAAIHGYNHPELNRAAKDQLEKMSHVMFGGITHRPAVELSELLVRLTPSPLEKVFLCDAGSVSVEVGIKMAMQYWFAQGNKKKQKLLTLRSGYHGDTFMAMSVCDPVNGMHEMYTQVLPQHHFAEAPTCDFHDKWDEKYIQDFKYKLEQNHQDIAAVILEPIVQGAGGMHFYSPEYLRRVRELCDQYEVLLILDEIATGFGRTGKMFACEHAGISPDIMCVGKAITGGYMTLAATLTTKQVGDGISRNGGVFMHGPTFMGNPLACNVAATNLNLLLQGSWREKVENIETQMQEELAPAKEFDTVHDVRVLGTIGVIELKKPVIMKQAQKEFVDKGVWIRPFGRLIYIMPPYIIKSEDLSTLTRVMLEVSKNPPIQKD